MRKHFGLLPLFALAACGGGGVNTIGGIAPPAGGGGLNTGTGTPTPTGTSFLTTNPARTYDAIGSGSSLKQQDDGSSLYQGDASTVAAPLGTIDYDPRDGIFTVKLSDTKAGLSSDMRTQDPAHRTDFDPTTMPQQGVPDLAGFNYLQVFNGTDDSSTFFYQRPGAATVYVSLAGYVRNSLPNNLQARAAFVFGDRTPLPQVPTSGTVTYKGGFLASMVNNPTFDDNAPLASYYQWIAGNSTVNIDFGKQTFTMSLDGKVSSPGVSDVKIADGTSFFASGSGRVDLLRNSGFAGTFQNACFAAACGSAGSVAVDFASVSPGSSTAGASSIDGAFFGPNGVEVGGSFRAIGGIPDQRVDITGAFTGAKVGQ